MKKVQEKTQDPVEIKTLEKYLILMKKYGAHYVKTKDLEINFVEHVKTNVQTSSIGFDKKPEYETDSDEELLFFSTPFKPKRKE